MMTESENPQPLLSPSRLWCRSEVLSQPTPVPRAAGVYAWYYSPASGNCPIHGLCLPQRTDPAVYRHLTDEASGFELPPSRQTLRHRIRYHYRGNTEGSTLRLTLGCILAEQLGIDLRRVGSGKRMTFGRGEALLSEWMAENALVTWQCCEQPWLREEQLISEVCLPLNLDQNGRNGFHAALSRVRSTARERARELRGLSLIATPSGPLPSLP